MDKCNTEEREGERERKNEENEENEKEDEERGRDVFSCARSRCDPRPPDRYKSSFLLVLNHAKTHALLIKETRGKQDKYGLPGGKVNLETDRHSLETAARELQEETNDLFRAKVYRRVRDGVGILGTEVYFDKARAVGYAIELSCKDEDLVSTPNTSGGQVEWVEVASTIFDEEWRASNMHFHASVLCAKLRRFAS